MMVAQDDELRDLLAQADPLGAGPLAAEAATTAALLDRVLEATADQAPGTEATADQAAGAPQRSWLQRHWQGSLLVAASVATLALATPVLAPGLLVVSGGDDSTAVSAADSAAAETAMAGVDSEDAASGQRLVRSGSLLVGTDDAASQRDAFVATVTGFGGRVVSESVVVQGGGAGYPADAAVTDFMGNYPSYPWYPTGPGFYLTVEVPVDRYDATMQAARDLGEVVQLQQSSFDVGTQIADVDARIAALQASLRTLRGLLDEAESVTDVVTLESAISERQAELDGLKAQQRDLANQTSMSTVTLTLMSPDDARQMVDPQPTRTWWESFLAGLADLWAWLGKALLITSPLLLAGAVIWWVRRRRNPGSRGTAA